MTFGANETFSWLQQKEREAMTSDRMAVLQVVGALRRYRSAVKDLLANRYSDGEVDAVALGQFESLIDDIESEPR